MDLAWSLLRGARSAITVALYTLLSPTGLLPFGIALIVWRNHPDRLARGLQWANVKGFRIALWWLRSFRVIHFDAGEARLRIPESPCVFLANHPTQIDPIAVMTCLGGGCTFVKPSVYRQKLLRSFLSKAMHIEGPSLDPASIEPVIANASARLQAGYHLFIFPEGTRSKEGSIRPFSRLPFEIAIRNRVPIVSLSLQCEPYYLTRETPIYKPPSRLPRLTLHQLAIDEPAQHGEDSKALKERVEGRYHAWAREALRPATPANG